MTKKVIRSRFNQTTISMTVKHFYLLFTTISNLVNVLSLCTAILTTNNNSWKLYILSSV